MKLDETRDNLKEYSRVMRILLPVQKQYMKLCEQRDNAKNLELEI